MRSVKLLVYKHDQNRLEEVALDVNLNPVFLSAIEMIDDENFLGADGRHIFVCQKNRWPDLLMCVFNGFGRVIYIFIDGYNTFEAQL